MNRHIYKGLSKSSLYEIWITSESLFILTKSFAHVVQHINLLSLCESSANSCLTIGRSEINFIQQLPNGYRDKVA